jgi:hypothetical protein
MRCSALDRFAQLPADCGAMASATRRCAMARPQSSTRVAAIAACVCAARSSGAGVSLAM